MKMIMAIVQPKDAGKLRDAFIDNNIGATKLSSTGGFLREGNTTYMVVVEDDRVDEVRSAYQKLARQNPDRIVTIDASQPLTQVISATRLAIHQRFEQLF